MTIRFRKRNLIAIGALGILLYAGVACFTGADSAVPKVFVRDTLSLNDWAAQSNKALYQQNGLMYKSDRPFSGYYLRYYQSGDTASIEPYLDGKLEGWSLAYYPNKRIMSKRFYKKGKRQGHHQGWWENGQRRFDYYFKDDIHEGSAQEWAFNSQQTIDFNYKNGYEDGLQRGWFSDGTLQFNYVVRNGRQYGLKGVKNCQSVWDETTKALIQKREKLVSNEK
jgi:antitoxin component YwqK of YwqJK toxin-antitoxin module